MDLIIGTMAVHGPIAHMLLKDDDLVRRYQKECKDKNEFVRRVLDDWLSRDDRDLNDSVVPRTWSSLAECISDADLPGDLATAINETCAGDLATAINAGENYSCNK